eukprot:3471668-Amphidinium_carterae.1
MSITEHPHDGHICSLEGFNERFIKTSQTCGVPSDGETSELYEEYLLTRAEYYKSHALRDAVFSHRESSTSRLE